MKLSDIAGLDWDKGDGLLPAIVQDALSGSVLMLGYMNREALRETLATRRVTFFSRAKQRLWTKGETSGHYLDCVEVVPDCDLDTLLVKAHPAYSGTIMNATFQIARDLGWGYFEKLAAQNVMQVQSATDVPKRISLGERAVMVDGAGYLVIRYKEAGQPVEIVYPEEGTPLATSPSAVFKAAPNPNAAPPARRCNCRWWSASTSLSRRCAPARSL